MASTSVDGETVPVAENQEESAKLLEIVIYYPLHPDEQDLPSTSTSIGVKEIKERARLPSTCIKEYLTSCTQRIIEYCGLEEESKLRGIQNISLKLAVIKKEDKTTRTYAVNTQEQWECERPGIVKGDTKLQVTVLKRVLTFKKGSKIIDVESSDGVKRKWTKRQGSGRKKLKSTKEDELLVKDLKSGKDPQRNDRQVAALEDMKKYLDESDMPNCEIIDEITIKCGRRQRLKTVAGDRKPKARIEYFKRKHYDKSCLMRTKEEEKRTSQRKDLQRMKSSLSNWLLTKDSHNSDSDDEKAIDSDIDNVTSDGDE